MQCCSFFRGGAAAGLAAFLALAAVPSHAQALVACPPLVRLPGRYSARVAPTAHSLGRLAPTETVSLALALPLRDQAGLQSLLCGLYDPHSPLYGQYLSSDEFTRRYGPTEANYQAVADYARGRGLTVTGTHPNRLLLDVQGPSDAVEAAFGVRLMGYRGADGRRFHVPDAAPSVPAALAGKLSGVIGLNTSALAKPHFLRRTPAPLVPRDPRLTPHDANGGYGPADITAAYDIPATVVPNEVNGAGRTLALYELDGYTPGDITQYETSYSLPTVPLTNILVGQADGSAGDGAGEVTLDIELMVALAPGATKILVYEGKNGTADQVDTYNRIATDNTAKEVSTSWGAPEDPQDTASLNTENAIFMQMAAQGQSLYAAAGDSGAYDDSQSLSVDDPASQPYVTGVGGTNLSVNTDGSYLSETAWGDPNEPSNDPNDPYGSGGGGGISGYWKATDAPYQTGARFSATAASATQRNVPDVSLDADPATGYSIYFSDPTYGAGFYVYGGTSCAAPLWAAFTALADQQRAVNGRPPLGFPNPAIYQIAAGANYGADFHDVTAGNNLYYNAATGYDNATGWGTFVGAPLLADLAAFGTATATPPLITHLLWSNTDGRAAFWNVDARGNPTGVTGYGPYTDGAAGSLWTATALATGPDGASHILWNNPDGHVALWNVTDGGAATVIANLGPYTDGSAGNLWRASGLSVGPDNVMHLLWTNPDHRAAFWNVTQSGSYAVLTGYGPFTDGSPNAPWDAVGISTGPDNVSHLSWANTDGKAAFWNVSDTTGSATALAGYGPFRDGTARSLWGAVGVSTGPDNVSHLLWRNPDGKAAFWNVSSADGTASVVAGYGPFTDGSASSLWSATGLTTGPAGESHLLWNNVDGRVALWSLDGSGNAAGVFGYGPYTDGAANNLWSAVGVSAGP